MSSLSLSDFEAQFPSHGDISEQIHSLLEAAVRAPSTHNSQPWRFKIEDNRLFVYRDTSINLPQSDSINRYAYISIGFLLHHISLLGTWLSMDPHVTVVNNSDCIAEITFSRTTKVSIASPLVEAIFKRRNRRGTFEQKLIPQSVIDQAIHVQDSPLSTPEVRVVTDQSSITGIANATAGNMERVYTKAEFRREMSQWITPTGSLRKDGIPGYSLNQPMILSWILPTVIRFVNMGKVLAKLNREAISSAPAAFGFGAPDEPSGWVSVGYAASHAVLTLVASSIDYSVFVASVEYGDTRELVGKVFGLQQPLEFLFVAGTLQGSATWMTPRVSVDDKLISS